MIYSSGECGSAPAQLQQPGAPPGNAESGRGGGEKGKERPKNRNVKTKQKGQKGQRKIRHKAEERNQKASEAEGGRGRKSGMKKSSGWGESGKVRMRREGETSSCAERTGEQIGPLTCFSLLTKEEDSGCRAS